MCFWFVNNLRICTRSLPANMQFQSQSPHCNLSHAQKKIDLYNQTKPSQDDRIPQRAQLELSGPDAEHVSLLRSSLHVTECSSGFLQADIIAPAARDINKAAAHLCLWGQLYNASLFALSHSTCLPSRADSGAVSLSTHGPSSAHLLCCFPAERSRTHGGTLPGLVPTFTPSSSTLLSLEHFIRQAYSH